MQPNLLNEEIRTQVAELFNHELTNQVELVYFSSKIDCETCETAQQLLEEISSISSLITLSVHDIEEEAELARDYNIQLAPGFTVAGLENGSLVDYGIRFLGIPSGYEFSSLIHAIRLVSRRESGLKTEIRNELKGIMTPIHLKVFVTPTCRYCPQAVELAHQMAMENPLIQAEMIEANEFYEIAMQYNVSGVPQTNINEGAGVVVGAVPEEYLLQEIIQAINS